MDSRLEHPVPFKYSDRVLVGNWVYRRINEKPEPKGNHSFASTYKTDFNVKQASQSGNTMVWDQIMRNEDSNFISEYDRMNYANFTSLYDLSYNHFPKCYKSEIERKWRMVKDVHEPIDEYLPVLGNMTKYGLLEQKRYTWEKDTDDPRITQATHYQCNFKPPKCEDYKFKRFVSPSLNAEELSPEEIENFKTKRRFGAKHDVVYSTSMEVHKNEKYCNPITWECTQDTK